MKWYYHIPGVSLLLDIYWERKCERAMREAAGRPAPGYAAKDEDSIIHKIQAR